MMRAALSLAAGAALLGLTNAANLTEWRSQSIYQVMIDRFARTDGSTTAECELYLFCNGTWQGLINNLDYITGMGFTAIQISPVVKNTEDNTAVGEGYHGYWSQDLYELNPHFGTESDFKNLVEAVHNAGMLLMVDVVVNNMAQGFNNTYPPPVDYSLFDPFNKQSYFHPYCNVTEWTNPTNYQDCWLYPYGIALADLNTTEPVVVDTLGSWVKDLVANYSIDGIRIDAAKHVDDAFLPKFVEASGVFAFGEVLTGEIDDMCRYQYKGLLPGMPNYLEYYPLQTVFNGGSMTQLQTIRSEAQATGACNDTTVLGTFVENHDMPRFAAANNDTALAKNAMTYVILNDGIPTVYQGQEQHFSGNGTPFNREPLWQSGYNTSAFLYTLTASLNKVRNQAISSSAKYVTELGDVLFVNDNHFCMSKGPMGSQIVFCINNQAANGPSYQLSVGGFNAGDSVVEVLSCETSTADGTGNVTYYMDKGEPKVHVLASMLTGTGLCNTTSPAGTSQSKNAAPAVSVAMSTAALAVLGWVAFFLV